MIETRGKGTKKRYLVRVAPFKSRTVYTREAAITLETSLKNRKVMGELSQAEPHTLAEEMAGRRERQNATKDFRPATLAGHKQIEKAWPTLQPLLVQSLTRQLVEDAFIKRAKTAPVQADKELQDIKAVLRDAASRGQRVDQAIFAIKAVNKKPRRGWALDVQQVRFLASWMPAYVQNIVPLAGLIGARQSFWFSLEDSMLDLDAGLMLAPAELMKNGRDHMVILAPREVTLFREQLLVRTAGTPLVFPTSTGRKWSRHNFRKYVWKSAVEAAAKTDPAFESFTFHLLRHTAGSLMAFSGLDPTTASERMGHTDGGALFLKTYRHVYTAERRKHAEIFGAWVDSEWDKEADDAQEAQA